MLPSRQMMTPNGNIKVILLPDGYVHVVGRKMQKNLKRYHLYFHIDE
jgi:hypothetical protein